MFLKKSHVDMNRKTRAATENDESCWCFSTFFSLMRDIPLSISSTMRQTIFSRLFSDDNIRSVSVKSCPIAVFFAFQIRIIWIFIYISNLIAGAEKGRKRDAWQSQRFNLVWREPVKVEEKYPEISAMPYMYETPGAGFLDLPVTLNLIYFIIYLWETLVEGYCFEKLPQLTIRFWDTTVRDTKMPGQEGFQKHYGIFMSKKLYIINWSVIPWN